MTVVDSVLVTALLFGALSALSLPLGALVGVLWTPPDRVVAFLLAFGGGALLAALTLDLVAPGVDQGHVGQLALGAVLGGLLFKALNWAVNRRGGYLRKPSTAIEYWRHHARERMETLVGELGRTRQLQDLGPAVLDDLAELLQVREVAAGTWLYRRGDPPSALFVIEAGRVALSEPDRGGAVFEHLGRHDAFGRMSFVTGLPRATEARVEHDSTLLVLPRQALLDRLPDSPELRRVLLHLVDAGEVETYLAQRHGIEPGQAREWRREAARGISQRGTYTPPMDEVSPGPGLAADLGADSHSDFFAQMNPDLREAFAARFVDVTVPAGRTLVRAGEVAERLVVVRSGAVTLVDADEYADDAAELTAPAVLGTVAFLTEGRHHWTALTRQACHLAVLRREDFLELLEEDPRARAAVAAHLQTAEVLDHIERSQDVDGRRAAAWTDRAARRVASGQLAPSVTELSRSLGHQSGAAMAMFLGILLDGIPESFVIGANVLSTGGLTLSLLGGLFLANFPEALSSSVGMREQGMRSGRILLMWTALMVITGIGAAIGAAVLGEVSPGAIALIEGVAAGAMLTMIAETMLPEAYHRGGGVVGLSTLGGFLAAILANHVG